MLGIFLFSLVSEEINLLIIVVSSVSFGLLGWMETQMQDEHSPTSFWQLGIVESLVQNPATPLYQVSLFGTIVLISVHSFIADIYIAPLQVRLLRSAPNPSTARCCFKLLKEFLEEYSSINHSFIHSGRWKLPQDHICSLRPLQNHNWHLLLLIHSFWPCL